MKLNSIKKLGPSWSYSWIYNYLCITKVASSNSVHGEFYSMVFPVYSGFLHQKNWLPWYYWNIESSIKHHKPNYEKVIFLLTHNILVPTRTDVWCIQPFYSFCVTPSWYINIYSWWIAGNMCLFIIHESEEIWTNNWFTC